MTATTVEDLIVDEQIGHLREVAESHGWLLEQAGTRCLRVTLHARYDDRYQLEVDYDGFPALPPALRWRNPTTGLLDQAADAPRPFGFFHSSNRICAPWNRFASASGGPHTEWVPANWQEQAETQGTRTLTAMVLRIHHELLSEHYRGRQQ